jgi:hypothetical protein
MKTEKEIEMERICTLANSMFGQDLLVAILKRVEPAYFWRDDRQPASELLKADSKEKAKLLHRIIGESDFQDPMKHTICAAVEFFLRNTCAVGTEEMQAFKATCQFDPATHNIFAGLGE